MQGILHKKRKLKIIMTQSHDLDKKTQEESDLTFSNKHSLCVLFWKDEDALPQ